VCCAAQEVGVLRREYIDKKNNNAVFTQLQLCAASRICNSMLLKQNYTIYSVEMPVTGSNPHFK